VRKQKRKQKRKQFCLRLPTAIKYGAFYLGKARNPPTVDGLFASFLTVFGAFSFLGNLGSVKRLVAGLVLCDEQPVMLIVGKTSIAVNNTIVNKRVIF
jgi:hypothetical protein